MYGANSEGWRVYVPNMHLMYVHIHTLTYRESIIAQYTNTTNLWKIIQLRTRSCEVCLSQSFPTEVTLIFVQFACVYCSYASCDSVGSDSMIQKHSVLRRCLF